jgi:hypothetical protein
MDTAVIPPAQPWHEAAYNPTTSLPGAGSLPPELAMLVAILNSRTAQTSSAKLGVDEAYEKLEKLRERVKEAMERAQEAQDDAGFWGDIGQAFGGDIASIAGLVAAGALVIGTGGSGAAVLAAGLAVGFAAGTEVAEELGASPEVLAALGIAGAAAGLLCGNVAGATAFWSSVATAASLTQAGATAVGGGAKIAEGQYEAAAVEANGQADFFRYSQDFEQQNIDDQIATIEGAQENWNFTTRAASEISEQRGEATSGLVMRIGA